MTETAKQAEEQAARALPVFGLAQDVAPALSHIAVHPVALVGQRAPAIVGDQKLRFVLNGEGAYWAKKQPDSIFVVLPFDVVVDALQSDETPTELGHFYLQYQVVYTLAKPIVTWDDGALESFAAYYGINHVWPYFRADLQMLTVKLGLAALTLPILKIGQLPPGFSISDKPPTGNKPEDEGSRD